VSLPFIFYFVWFVFLVCLYYVYLYMGQVPELKLMMMMMITRVATKLKTIKRIYFKLEYLQSYICMKYSHNVKNLRP